MRRMLDIPTSSYPLLCINISLPRWSVRSSVNETEEVHSAAAAGLVSFIHPLTIRSKVQIENGNTNTLLIFDNQLSHNLFSVAQYIDYRTY